MLILRDTTFELDHLRSSHASLIRVGLSNTSTGLTKCYPNSQTESTRRRTSLQRPTQLAKVGVRIPKTLPQQRRLHPNTNEYTDSYIKLIYLRSRWYDPASGRFNTKDSWQGDYNRPMSYNGWLYVFANPVNYTDPSGQKCAELSCNSNVMPSYNNGSVSYSLIAALLPLAESGCLGLSIPFLGPPEGGYVEGFSIAQGIGKGEIVGQEIVYDYATMTRAKFRYFGTIGLAPSGVSGSIYAGSLLGFSWNNEYLNQQIIADYSGPFEGFYLGVGTPIAYVGAGVGFFHDLAWKVRGEFSYYSLGFSLLPGEVVSFRTEYRGEPASIVYYADRYGNVDKSKLIGNILTGNESPIGLGIFPELALQGIGSQRLSQIGRISIAALKFEFYWKLRHIFDNGE